MSVSHYTWIFFSNFQDHVSDVVDKKIPTLEDLGVTLTEMESQIPWELRPFKSGAYYDEELGEFQAPAPPKVCV